MKKKYRSPELKIQKFRLSDAILISDEENLGDYNGGELGESEADALASKTPFKINGSGFGW